MSPRDSTRLTWRNEGWMNPNLILWQTKCQRQMFERVVRTSVFTVMLCCVIKAAHSADITCEEIQPTPQTLLRGMMHTPLTVRGLHICRLTRRRRNICSVSGKLQFQLQTFANTVHWAFWTFWCEFKQGPFFVSPPYMKINVRVLSLRSHIIAAGRHSFCAPLKDK